MKKLNKFQKFSKAVNLGAAGIAIGMKAFLAMKSPAEFSPEWVTSLSDDELEIQIERVKLQQVRKDRKAKEKLEVLREEKRRRARSVE